MRRALALASMVALAGCDPYRDSITLPAVGTKVPATVPLDLSWQVSLYIWPHVFLNSRAPLGVVGDPHARQPSQCSAHVVGHAQYGGQYPRLVVDGRAEGSCEIDFRYTHPTLGDPRTATFRVVFGPPETLPEVGLGTLVPARAFMISATPELLGQMDPTRALTRGESSPVYARCEAAEHGSPDVYACSLADDQGRYASLDLGAVASDDELVLCIRRDDDSRVVGIRALNRTLAASGDPACAR